MFKLGQRVFRADLDGHNPFEYGIVTRVSADSVQLDNDPEKTFYSAFLWPEECAEGLEKIIAKRVELKKKHTMIPCN